METLSEKNHINNKSIAMKISVEFEDHLEAELCLNANKWYSVLFDLDQYLRAAHKYGNPILDKEDDCNLSETDKNSTSVSEIEGEVAWKVRQKISQLMLESNISF